MLSPPGLIRLLTLLDLEIQGQLLFSILYVTMLLFVLLLPHPLLPKARKLSSQV
jgi:hypothetical protein